MVNEYKNIENEILNKLNGVGKELDKYTPILDEGIELTKSGLFNWEGTRVYKFSLSKNGNKVWIQFVKREIHLFSNYYLQDGTDPTFNDILMNSGINRHLKIDHKQSKNELKEIFLSQVQLANNSFMIYKNEFDSK